MNLLQGVPINSEVNLRPPSATLILSPVNPLKLYKSTMRVLLSAVIAVGPCYSYANPSDAAFSYQTEFVSSETEFAPSQAQYSYTDPESGNTFDVEVNTFPIGSDEDLQRAHQWFQNYKSQYEQVTPEVPLTVVQEEQHEDFEYIHEEFVTDYELVDKIELKRGMMAGLQNWLSDTREKLTQKVDRLVELGNTPIKKKEPSTWQTFRNKMAGFMENHPWKFRGSLAFLRFTGVSAASVFSAVYFAGLPLGPSLAVGLGWYGLFTFAIQMRTDLYSWFINNLSVSAVFRKMKTGETYAESLAQTKKNVGTSIFDKLMVFNGTEIPVLGIGALAYWWALGHPLYNGAIEHIVTILTGTTMAMGAQGVLDVSVSTKDEIKEREILSHIKDENANAAELMTDLQMSKLGSAFKFFVVGVLANFAVLLHSTATSDIGNPDYIPLSGAMVAALGLYGIWDLIDAYKDTSPAMARMRKFLTSPYRKFKKTCSDLFSPDPNEIRF